MGYQESLFYIKPQSQFDKMVRAYEKAEITGYYEIAGAKPRSVIVLKKPLGQNFCGYAENGVFILPLECSADSSVPLEKLK